MIQTSFEFYKENHGEIPSIIAENKRKMSRKQKAEAVMNRMKRNLNGLTALEMWSIESKYYRDNQMNNIYDLRRILSMLKSFGLIYHGKPRICSIGGVNMYAWFVK